MAETTCIPREKLGKHTQAAVRNAGRRGNTGLKPIFPYFLTKVKTT